MNPELYLHPCGDRLKKWLTELKKRQVTYLISGSDPDYVEWVAGYCLGNDWKNYFDYVVCASKKPGFFSGKRPFRQYLVGRNSVGVEDEDIDIDVDLPANASAIYVHGNWYTNSPLLTAMLIMFLKLEGINSNVPWPNIAALITRNASTLAII